MRMAVSRRRLLQLGLAPALLSVAAVVVLLAGGLAYFRRVGRSFADVV